MITDISTGQHLVTVSGPAGTYYNNTGRPMTGMLCYNSGGRIEVYDGNQWHQVNTQCSINLTSQAESAIWWAMEKQKEERQLSELCKKHPGLADAKEKFDVMLALVREHNDQRN
jgi:hypothetical protein